MTDQARKHAIGLAGEFLVAGELLRRGIHAAVTYGNAKKADVVAINGDKATALEVKTTSAEKWVLGSVLPDSDTAKLWVLVHLPAADAEPPEYFILSGAELHTLLLPEHERYLRSYREKNKKEFTGPGVVSVPRSAIPEHRAAWHKVKAQVM